MQSFSSVSPVFLPGGPPKSVTPAVFVLLVLFSFSPRIAVQADALTDMQKRDLHEFKQCTNPCQVELDEGLERCPEYSDDSDNIGAQGCRVEVRRQHQQCLMMCPADPRPDQR